MPLATETAGQLCLSQDQYAFLQDATKGTVSVFAGPYSFSLSANDRPVKYDAIKKAFVLTSVSEAITQNLMVEEGHYILLENPSFDSKGELHRPSPGNNSPTGLLFGRKIVQPGPLTLALWPGQYAEVIKGHHLHSNQFVLVRVYNAEEANKNIPDFLLKIKNKNKKVMKGKAEEATPTEVSFTPGQLLVITGEELSFFIPPTGFEVITDNGEYVREALTLERLEYCILLDEDGNKRYERGPKVVFPSATERFVTKGEKEGSDGGKSIKFKAIDLNDQTGLYIKIIADYEEGDKKLLAGEELFITGKEQRIYYPRPEHALVSYEDPKKNMRRERYYGITIPPGEARYVLDKNKGVIEKVEGPQIFLPDPRNQVVVRRVLDNKTVDLWYPGNVEAKNYNETLRSLNNEASSLNYLADSIVVSAANVDSTRGLNRGTEKSRVLGTSGSGSFEGDKFERGTKYTPPPTLTLTGSKYEGVPSISPYTGYAVQVVDKSGKRRVEIGPTTVLLNYDETLETLELSTGKPKTTDRLLQSVYLRIDNNLVSDIVEVLTKDTVALRLKLSYRVNFLKEHKDKWFSVENYVKYLCDHMRSILKGAIKKSTFADLRDDATAIIRDILLGKKDSDRHKFFPENGMDVYDVEVLGVELVEGVLERMQKEAEIEAVRTSITLATEERKLITTRRQTEIAVETAELEAEAATKRWKLDAQVDQAEYENKIATLEAEIAEQKMRLKAKIADDEARLEAILVSKRQELTIMDETFERTKTAQELELTLETARTGLYKEKMEAISPSLVTALTTMGERDLLTALSTAVAPLAIAEQTGISTILSRLLEGTAAGQVLTNLEAPRKTSSATAGGKK